MAVTGDGTGCNENCFHLPSRLMHEAGREISFSLKGPDVDLIQRHFHAIVSFPAR
jgi:hypothetical protein